MGTIAVAQSIAEHSLSNSVAARPESYDALSALAYHASQLVHSELGVADVVERIGSLALYSLRAESIRIVLLSLEEGAPRLEEFAERRGATEAVAPEFLFARRIAVRGVEYGQLELALRRTPWPVASLLALAETLVELLAQRAEREELRVNNAALRQGLAQLDEERQFDILLTRASGVVAREHGWSVERAQASIVEEAHRAGLAVLRYAERIVLGHKLRRRALRSVPGLPVGKTA